MYKDDSTENWMISHLSSYQQAFLQNFGKGNFMTKHEIIEI